MIKIMKDCWNENEYELREALKEHTGLNDCSYKDLVKIAFKYIYNTCAKSRFGVPELNLDRITEINDGSYQGTLVYMIPFDTYQPDEGEYLTTYVGYGSCSHCDTLQSIQYYVENVKPTDEQLAGFMILCKDIICNTIRPYNVGWRENDIFGPVEID